MKSRPFVAAFCLAVPLLLAACKTPLPLFQSDKWEHDGVVYKTSAEYLEAVERDQFTRTYPPQASLSDFRRYDDMRLGLYYFHYVKDPQAEMPDLSMQTRDDLEQAMEERGVDDRWFGRIDEGAIDVDMPLVALYASWGPPWDGYRSRTRQGETVIQHIYMDASSRRTHVFTTGGKVTSWSY